MITSMEYDPEKTDLWSSGITLFNMLTGKLPFLDTNIKALYKKIVNGHVDYPSFLSKEAIDLLQSILKTNPKQRLTFKQTFNHPWMQKFKPKDYPLVFQKEKVGMNN